MWLVFINKHIIESITDYNFVNTYWYIHIFVWMLLECIGRLYIINALVKPNDKPSNINNVDLQNVKLFFSFDIEHIKLFETIQWHVLNTFKNVNKEHFYLLRRYYLYKLFFKIFLSYTNLNPLSLHIYFVIWKWFL